MCSVVHVFVFHVNILKKMCLLQLHVVGQKLYKRIVHLRSPNYGPFLLLITNPILLKVKICAIMISDPCIDTKCMVS